MDFRNPGQAPEPVVDAGDRWLAGANVLAVAAFAAWAWQAFPTLPARYPIHWNASWQADGWAPGDSPTWFLLPGIAAGISLLMVALALTIPRHGTRWVNLPYKVAFQALPRAAQVPVLRSVCRMLLCDGLALVGMFASMQRGLYQAALGLTEKPDPLLMFGGVAVVVALNVAWTVRLALLVRRATRA